KRLIDMIKVGWHEEPIILVSIVGAIIAPLVLFLSPTTKRTYKKIEAFPRTYPWPGPVSEREEGELGIRITSEHDYQVPAWIRQIFTEEN
uniref:hypothetical protein n=1 Tax=Salmonella sp. s51228 TaxID=3159652 RepID=UPI00397FBE9C